MQSLLHTSLLALTASVAAPATVRAQGSDDCSTPRAIAGTGTFTFDTRSATTGSEAQTFGECFAFGAFGVDRDVWFVWTAPLDGNVEIATCGLTGVDTKIALYGGSGCPSSAPIACTDDSCGYQSKFDFPAAAGSTYTIQLGSFPSAPGGVGSFSIEYAPPPPYCLTGTGPDVVLGEIGSVFNAPAEAAIDALAIGTVACNVGTAPVDWDGSQGRSPAVRQNLFRYSMVDGAGRFEQVGLSWLKHGFFAVQESFCCQCLAEPGTAQLGVGCADTYVAGINSAQQFLTPNWEVNAHTGERAHPPSDPPWSGTVARRLQVKLADLVPTGRGISTRYFAEGLYAAHDDATAGNQDNNASWREMTVSGGPSEFDFGLFPSPTQRAQSAIHAWRKIDPLVRCAEVRVPGDGLLFVCWRVTALPREPGSESGGTRWRYEYALYNMNSDRNVGAFAVPVPDGAAIVNVGFHDVDYHSGDGPGDADFSARDWPGTLASGSLTWACETRAQTESANALRWGTLYNFRFDSDRPPRPATAMLGLWKTGSPARVPVEVEGPGDPALAAFCAGDGSLAPCPCANDGAPEHGCENSASSGGALLSFAGHASLSADDFVLTSSGELPVALSIFLQGDQETSASAFGDGLGCAGGNLKRLYIKSAVAGSASAPTGGDPSISARSAALGDPISPNGVRFYQVAYRDPLASFCPDPPGGTFNASSGVRAIWGF